ncbi:MAG: acetyltransferase [Chlorobiaceae bacterium]|nr:acetyltransferase [Chlorobiaceae bacterium]
MSIKHRVLFILGASGHGMVVAEAAISSGWDDVVFYDDAWPTISCIGPWQVIGNSQSIIEKYPISHSMIVAIGNNHTRLQKIKYFENKGFTFPVITHPSCIISRSARIGKGTVIIAGSIINALSDIGTGCIINTGATIDHHCILKDGVHVSPGAHLAGGVQIGEECWIGMGSCIKQGIIIGDRSIIGMGSVVIQDINSDVTVAGVPAKELTYESI